jgi:CRP-like cAMP-binding protein
LILTGKVNCLLGRNICFKSYPQGSYFGDFEVLTNQRRLFSVRAEEPTTLVVIDKAMLEYVLETHPQSHRIIWQKTLERYLKARQSLFRVESFRKISVKDSFWDDPGDDELMLNSLFDELLDTLVMPTWVLMPAAAPSPMNQ